MKYGVLEVEATEWIFLPVAIEIKSSSHIYVKKMSWMSWIMTKPSRKD